ncbi:MAG: hypothetical protein U5K38_04535 [Woeseiaceae bacterium]|nr:hypothetical protein [Woeseiaceae bacterium]
MAEAEEVVSDVARHATSYARDLWHRHRGMAAVAGSTWHLQMWSARVDIAGDDRVRSTVHTDPRSHSNPRRRRC